MARRKLIIGAVIGAAVGLVAGILTAPKSGKNTRKDIVSKANNTMRIIANSAKQKATDIKNAIRKRT